MRARTADVAIGHRVCTCERFVDLGDQVTVPLIGACPAKAPQRSATGASSASASSSCHSERQISTERPPRRLSRIVRDPPPAPARPLNGTGASLTARRSSSARTLSRVSSPRPRRRRALCGLAASGPDGVRHASPGRARQVGQDRPRQARATCRTDDGALRGVSRHVAHLVPGSPASPGTTPQAALSGRSLARSAADTEAPRRAAGVDRVRADRDLYLLPNCSLRVEGPLRRWLNGPKLVTVQGVVG
jgi:hypothetical protein